MRLLTYALCCGLILGYAQALKAEEAVTPPAPDAAGNGRIEVTADKSLEWYEDTRLYVARGNAKAVRGDMTVEADLLTAHEREAAPKNPPAEANVTSPATPAAAPDKKAADKNGTGDVDKMTAEGNVRITTSKSKITGDHGVYDLSEHVAYVTGGNLKYATPDETVTAKKSLEYWEDKKLAVARGNAVAIRGDRHVEGDVLTAQFRDMPNGKSELHTMTAEGNVVVITKSDISRANRAVYDISRNIAVLTGNVRITRPDGTQFTGDVGEVDFAANQSRLLNQGTGRVRALLTSKPTGGNKTASTTSNP